VHDGEDFLSDAHEDFRNTACVDFVWKEALGRRTSVNCPAWHHRSLPHTTKPPHHTLHRSSPPQRTAHGLLLGEGDGPYDRGPRAKFSQAPLSRIERPISRLDVFRSTSTPRRRSRPCCRSAGRTKSTVLQCGLGSRNLLENTPPLPSDQRV